MTQQLHLNDLQSGLKDHLINDPIVARSAQNDDWDDVIPYKDKDGKVSHAFTGNSTILSDIWLDEVKSALSWTDQKSDSDSIFITGDRENLLLVLNGQTAIIYETHFTYRPSSLFYDDHYEAPSWSKIENTIKDLRQAKNIIERLRENYPKAKVVSLDTISKDTEVYVDGIAVNITSELYESKTDTNNTKSLSDLELLKRLEQVTNECTTTEIKTPSFDIDY